MESPSLFHAILLGLVEGITEFLPISSTGHLILTDELLGVTMPGGVFEIVIQLGAILAVCWLYRTTFLNVAVNYARETQARRFVHTLLLAFMPSAVIGFLAHDVIKEQLFSPVVVAVALIAGGIAILVIEARPKTARYEEAGALPFRTALLIGFFQTIALIPGVSRSGATIMGALLCGVERKAAAEFSFFLAVPTMLAASAYSLYKSYHLLDSDGLLLIGVGFVTAFLSALAVVKWLVGFVGRHGFEPFAWYRIVLGSVMLWWFCL